MNDLEIIRRNIRFCIKYFPRNVVLVVLGRIAQGKYGRQFSNLQFSKDEILASLNHEGHTFFFFVAVAGAFITAFYMTSSGNNQSFTIPLNAPEEVLIKFFVNAQASNTALECGFTVFKR